MKSLLQLVVVLVKWVSNVKGSRSTFIFAIIAGVVAGLSNAAIIAVINSVFTKGLSKAMAWSFVGLCVAIPLSGFTSQALLIRLTEQATRDLRIRLSQQILSAPYRLLEELGVHRLLGTIIGDVTSVTTGIGQLPVLGTQFAVIVGCLAYLAWLSRPLFLLMLGFMVVGVLSYKVPKTRAIYHFQILREKWDFLFKAIQALTEGVKELKLNRERRAAFMTQELEPAINGVYRHGLLGQIIAIAAANWGGGLFFLVIGLILSAGSRSTRIDHQTLTGYTLTILFMISPLSSMLNTLPTLGRAYVAAEKVHALGFSLTVPSLNGEKPAQEMGSWTELRLSHLSHAYRQDGMPDEFRLGPIDLLFRPGEIVFITGGNGSGKTTLVKLLIGLYEADDGKITLDGKVITSGNRDTYRQLFSVVFYDFYLFDRPYGVDLTELKEKAKQFLQRLQMSQKLVIEEGRFSTIDLSQGQRKRLALLTAYLEDRPIYVFDEWASDQDPQFKKIFYYEILPDLKAKGKTVIVISHDDRYYGVADRIIKMERGQIECDHRRDAPVFAESDSLPVAPSVKANRMPI